MSRMHIAMSTYTCGKQSRSMCWSYAIFSTCHVSFAQPCVFAMWSQHKDVRNCPSLPLAGRPAPLQYRWYAVCTASFSSCICSPGVLKYKRQSEQLLEQSGIPWTIFRPGRLTDGPYTSYDLNTLLQATSGNRQDVQLTAKDELNGQASRVVLAGVLLHLLSILLQTGTSCITN